MTPSFTVRMRARRLLLVVMAVLARPCTSDANRDQGKAIVHAAAQQHILRIQRALEQGEIAQLEKDMARQAEEVI